MTLATVSPWPSVTLAEVAMISSGGTPLKSKQDYWDGEIPWYSSGELNSEYTATPKRKITQKGLANSNAKIFPAGSLLIGMYDTAAMKMSILDRDATFNQAVAGVRPSPQLNLRFAKFALEQMKPMILMQRRGTRQKNLSLQKIKALPIPLPPLQEQRRIVAVLDEAFAAIATAIANAERNLANARELFGSELSRLFKVTGANWLRKPVGEVADARLGKMLDKQKNKGSLKPYLRNLNVRWFRFDLSDLLEMRFEDAEQDRYTAKRGDLLIVEGGYPGRAAIWEGDEPIFFQKAVHRVRFDDPLLARLLMYMLFAQDADGTLSQHFSGSGIQHLTGQALARIQMPVPPPSERGRIIAKVEALHSMSEEVERLYQAKIVALGMLKQSLLHRAFSGELTD